ncbi:carboxypeptidase-like regulatory domain-containing protein [Mariniblastus fucicola]|uniref:NOMO second beta-sandwich domain-containing protein n=1 Tax=Mariniblastus fucicola TaxID=980251 RepID=A0A5B9PCD4_9BACT|nr:carboxypeptidase-like regulatory domain-containing protein [Mariniblastus fucicola]QEG22825.1 hypothetical protein MFFC18_27100 [Mariniblastus fucicola]
MLIKKFAAVLMCCLFAAAATAQDAKIEAPAVASDAATTVVKKSVKVMLNEEGALEGKAFLEESKEVAANVKVSLSANGKVIDAVETDEKGNFSFANVAPGAYQMLGSADGYVGTQSYNVVPYSSPAVGSPCSLGMCGASSNVVYDNYASAPVSSFSSSCGSCNTCGGGLGGGRLGGRLGGGLLSNGRIGLIGLAGLAGLAGDDASPDR